MFPVKKWILPNTNKSAAAELAQAAGISQTAAGILLARGIENPAQARDFLYGRKEPFYSPWLLKDMEKAAARIVRALEKGERICLYGDYDVDGVTAVSLLYRFFRDFAYPVEYCIPDRQTEGYGLNGNTLRQIAAGGAALVITVDCGVSAVEEIKNAPPGLDVIITDHHTPPAELPASYALINPKQTGCPYPCKELAGVGVAFKLCQGLWQKLKNADEFWTGSIELAALGTVADIVPLFDENREIARLGIKALNNTDNVGLRHLIKEARLEGRAIGAGDISFGLAPRLNASGRLSSARRGVELLTTDDPHCAGELAQQLEQENAQRQSIEKQIFAEAEELLIKQGGAREFLVLAGNGWHPGVIGIVASRLVERYNAPAALISVSGGDDVCKASCRSISRFNMYEALSYAGEHLLRYGGHAQAAGFSIKKDKIADFSRTVIEYARNNLTADDYLPRQRIDMEIDGLCAIDGRLLRELSALEPFGAGNPEPVLAAKEVLARNITVIGRDKQHLKFRACGGGRDLPVIMWRGGGWKDIVYEESKLGIAFKPKEDEWNKVKTITLIASDLKPRHIVYDFRGGAGFDRIGYLKELAARRAEIFVYCPDRECQEKLAAVLPDTAKFDLAAAAAATDAAFAQPPFAALDDQNFWCALRKLSIKTAHLLYNIDDVNNRLDLLASLQPDAEFLRGVYRHLRALGGASAEELPRLAEGRPLAAVTAALQILREIGAIRESAGSFFLSPLNGGTKLSLDLSDTYRQKIKDAERARSALAQCISLSREEMARLVFGE
ncbi:MAG: single-stranded-DNA-specific exonuclease RecJ [Acidaminococcales bacterium]|jgi:single-stranded-DNA-specific exonuclease|nr:single-stranded-DNA-specific exonuclease RecJ [Acidaminococcales bacterium]